MRRARGFISPTAFGRLVPLPPDILRVLEEFRKLGEASRRGLHLAERRTRHEVVQAARRAWALERELRMPRRR